MLVVCRAGAGKLGRVDALPKWLEIHSGGAQTGSDPIFAICSCRLSSLEDRVCSLLEGVLVGKVGLALCR